MCLILKKLSAIKSRIDTVTGLSSKQHVVSSRRLFADVIGVYREETIAGITVLNVREGAVINQNEFIFNKGKDVSCLKNYYACLSCAITIQQ